MASTGTAQQSTQDEEEETPNEVSGENVDAEHDFGFANIGNLDEGESQEAIKVCVIFNYHSMNGPFSYSAQEPGLSVIFIHFIHEARLSGIRASITIVHIRNFYEI